MIRALIVDDEPLALEGLRTLLAEEADIEVVGECLNGREAVTAIKSLRPHLVFLDVQMPVFDGFEVIEELEPEEIPVVVFVTAFDQYALQAFAVHALDYLLKPVEPGRFRAALAHVRETLAGRFEHEADQKLPALLEAVESRRRPADRFVIRDGGRTTFLKAPEVDAIEAADVYAVLHRGRDSFVLRESLSSLETRLDGEKFLRTHRSWIVNADRILEIREGTGGGHEIRLSSGLTVPISRRHRAGILSRLARTRAGDS
jgi:two-component system, LytTR family, response regulator